MVYYELSLYDNWLFVLVESTTAAPAAKVDHTTTIVAGVLGGVYGIAGLTALIFIVLPRLMAGPAAAAAGGAGAVRPSVRWTPRYGNNFSRPGSYLPRDGAAGRVWSSLMLLRVAMRYSLHLTVKHFELILL